MKLNYKHLFIKINILLFCLPAFVVAAIPNGYYINAEGKKDAELKTALFTTINSHTQLEYYSLSTYFRTTDWNPAGYFWDMYSTIQRTSWSGLNREHSLPKSWFGIASGEENSEPIGSDLHNLYPSDATANSAKSNYPPGEVGSSSFDNGIFKVGANTFNGYSGTVFEPSDEYKGDFARDYMYMVTCYENYSDRWTSTGTASMLDRNTYPVFKQYAINLLLKWSRNDPVSEKEINRNDAVYGFQHNRNPFIDHPELAEYIWGKYKGYVWTSDATVPEIDDQFNAWYNNEDHTVNVNLTYPANAYFYIDTLQGEILVKGNFSSNGKVSVDLKQGIYIMIIYTKSTRKTQKFVVE